MKIAFATGTLGHVDHGKTTLTAAITAVLARQRLASVKHYDEICDAPEATFGQVQARASRVEYESHKRRYTHVDCPAHDDYVKVLGSGAAWDAAILVVAAPEGLMPESDAQVLLARQAGIPHVVVYLTKCEFMDDDQIELVEDDVRAVLSKHGFACHDAVLIRGSGLGALNGEEPWVSGIHALIEALDALPDPHHGAR